MTDTFWMQREGNVIAVLTFGIPASRSLQVGVCRDDPNIVVELNRLWVAENEPRNTASWFISKCLKMMPPRIVVSFADTRQGHDGTVYRAANFFYSGWTDMDRKTPRFHYEDEFVSSDLFGELKKTKHDRHADKKTSKKVRRLPKAKYWTVTGDKRDKARLKKMCGWGIISWREYPVPFKHKRQEIAA